MKPYPFDKKQQKWIEKNYKNHTTKEIADFLGVKKHQIWRHTGKVNLRKNKEPIKKDLINEGIFKIEEKKDWLI